MSRYALEWAKQQVPDDPAAKVILLLLADCAEGAKHEGTVTRAGVAQEASLDHATTADAIDRLKAQGLLGMDDPSYWGVSQASKFNLNIPASWRCVAAKPPRKAPGQGERPTAVYRLYDRDGRLLYVGISDKPEHRFGQHERDKYWWRDVVTREVTWYPDRRLAEAEEYRAIASEAPEYNIDVAGVSRFDGRPQEDRQRRYVTANSRLGKFEKVLVRLGEDIEANAFEGAELPLADSLAERYGVDAVTVQQALRSLRQTGVVVEHTGGKYWPARRSRRWTRP